ncbi:hypothetical protein BMETH_2482_0 [methanotrophic bacterial endosymbiont of Bathymodiolus sp.]|nr:hypothetical protein BMETH_2482_0 [methanotrophic bacterial endosymbiont of Bathymodiolus sp.]
MGVTYVTTKARNVLNTIKKIQKCTPHTPLIVDEKTHPMAHQEFTTKDTPEYSAST